MKRMVVWGALCAVGIALAAPATYARGRGDWGGDDDGGQARIGRGFEGFHRHFGRAWGDDDGFGWGGGMFLGPAWDSGFWLAATIGTVIPWLPFGYQVVWVGPHIFYTYDGVWYTPLPGDDGYEVVEPPTGATMTPPAQAKASPAKTAATAPSQKVVTSIVPQMRPTKGQSADQIARDKYESHLWAVSQSGYDPTQGVAAPDSVQAAYARAYEASMESRGYVAADTTNTTK